MVQSFGPTASWQQLGRIDASTKWGCGGFIFDGSSMYGFMHRWDERERRLAKCKTTHIHFQLQKYVISLHRPLSVFPTPKVQN